MQGSAWARLRHGHEGQGLVEYTMILALVTLVCIVAFTAFGTSVSALINSATNIF